MAWALQGFPIVGPMFSKYVSRETEAAGTAIPRSVSRETRSPSAAAAVSPFYRPDLNQDACRLVAPVSKHAPRHPLMFPVEP